ncbi:hypothetical protein FA13DRAFT_1794644 [Coprinellus micaceus]|uniref:Uncharacterized protein n=1 Tax=Coprinellus micaceus TaxID=71717 RepID=A0A4Y7T172_COPMI|nr:hypothetical protein FA13DRAFT_1794644 [Coprinellus micaceus]
MDPNVKAIGKPAVAYFVNAPAPKPPLAGELQQQPFCKTSRKTFRYSSIVCRVEPCVREGVKMKNQAKEGHSITPNASKSRPVETRRTQTRDSEAATSSTNACPNCADSLFNPSFKP